MSKTLRANAEQGPMGTRRLLLTKKVWIVPLVIASVFIALVSAIYIGSTVNPTGHLHGLPVMVVNEDSGAHVGGHEMNVGASIVSALERSAAVTSRLKLESTDISHAHSKMNKAGAYATLVIPATLSRSVLLAAGHSSGGSQPPARATIELEENLRMGSLGVNLAAGVIAPATSEISPSIGRRLWPLVTATTKSDPVLADRVANPIALSTVSYRPLPDHSGLGLSAFYIALLSILSGFVGATLINSSIDGALGYSTTELGPRWKQRRPVVISRRQTLLTKWVTAVVAAPVLTGILLLVATGALGMHAPHVWLLWLLCSLAALMISTGTLALVATFGSIGQLLAMLLLIYLSLASSGGTVPIQALPGVFNVVGHVEPLRQVLSGTRAVLYFGAQGDAGLTHSLGVIAAELVFWAVVGIGVTSWYDRRKLDRISPDLLRYVGQAIDRRTRADGPVPASDL
jgi:YhgE/Pip-like protein